MPRSSRRKGEFSTYHVIQRGNEKKDIFLCDQDKIRFLETLRRMKEKYNFLIEAYCLMDNHVHLIINDNGNDISKIIKSINISYAYYFNNNYKRVGHLFQDRFKSELVKDDRYLRCLSTYIHNNPVKAGMVKLANQYKWSSINFYSGKNQSALVYTDRVLGLFSNSRNNAIKEYIDYVNKYKTELDEDIMDVDEDKIIDRLINPNYIDSYETAQKLVVKKISEKGIGLNEINLNKEFRQELILLLRSNSSLTLKEIGELCGGITQSSICKILKG